jgi:hypothetical protein
MSQIEQLRSADAGESLVAGPLAVSARYDKRIHRLVIELQSGIDIAVRLSDIPGLETAKAADLDVIEIGPSGQGLRFPKVDASLELAYLLRAMLRSPDRTEA